MVPVVPGNDPPMPTREEVDALLREANWRAVEKRLMTYAMFRTHHDVEASRDLVQGAIARVLDAAYTGWNPNARSLEHHLMRDVNSLLAADRKHSRVHHEIAMADAEEHHAHGREVAAAIDAEKAVDPHGTPEQALIDADLRARRTALLRARLERKDDRLALRVLELFEKRCEKPAEQALASGRPVSEIVNARERLFYQAKKVAEELADPVENDQEEEAPESEDVA